MNAVRWPDDAVSLPDGTVLADAHGNQYRVERGPITIDPSRVVGESVRGVHALSRRGAAASVILLSSLAVPSMATTQRSTWTDGRGAPKRKRHGKAAKARTKNKAARAARKRARRASGGS